MQEDKHKTKKQLGVCQGQGTGGCRLGREKTAENTQEKGRVSMLNAVMLYPNAMPNVHQNNQYIVPDKTSI